MKTICKECKGEAYYVIPKCCGMHETNGECCGEPFQEKIPCQRCSGMGYFENEMEYDENLEQEINDISMEINEKDLNF